MRRWKMKGVTALLLAAVLTTGMLPVHATAPQGETTPLRTDNAWKQYYISADLDGPSEANLFANSDGGYTRVEYHSGPDGSKLPKGGALGKSYKHVALETYGSDFQLISRVNLPGELEGFTSALVDGDFAYVTYYASGEDTEAPYYYERDPNLEFLRVVKYDRKTGKVLGRASFTHKQVGYMTAGHHCNSKMMMYDGVVYLLTAGWRPFNLYGERTQTSFLAALDSRTMKPVSLPDGLEYATGISNSYQVELMAREDRVFAAVHAVNSNFEGVAAWEMLGGSSKSAAVATLAIPGFRHYSDGGMTGVTLGGMGVTDETILVAGTSVEPPTKEAYSASEGQAVVVGVSRRSLSGSESGSRAVSSELKWITQPDKKVITTSPYLVDLEDDTFMLLWGERPKGSVNDTWEKAMLYYARIDGNGELIGDIREADGDLSDCTPVYQDGKVVWYVNENYMAPVFYALDVQSMSLLAYDTERSYLPPRDANVIRPMNSSFQPVREAISFSDVEASDWYRPYVRTVYQYGLMQGTSADQFAPGKTLTLAECITLATHIHRLNTPGAKTIGQGSPWYQPYVDYAVENGLLLEAPTDQALSEPTTRRQFVMLVDAAYQTREEGSGSWYRGIPDVKLEDEAYGAIYRAYRLGLLSGSDDKGSFRGDSTITRAEVAAILSHVVDDHKGSRVTLSAYCSTHNDKPSPGWESVPDRGGLLPDGSYPPNMIISESLRNSLKGDDKDAMLRAAARNVTHMGDLPMDLTYIPVWCSDYGRWDVLGEEVEFPDGYDSYFMMTPSAFAASIETLNVGMLGQEYGEYIDDDIHDYLMLYEWDVSKRIYLYDSTNGRMISYSFPCAPNPAGDGKVTVTADGGWIHISGLRPNMLHEVKLGDLDGKDFEYLDSDENGCISIEMFRVNEAMEASPASFVWLRIMGGLNGKVGPWCTPDTYYTEIPSPAG